MRAVNLRKYAISRVGDLKLKEVLVREKELHAYWNLITDYVTGTEGSSVLFREAK